MVAEAAEDAMNADGAEVEALVTATSEAHTLLTLVRAPPPPSASRVGGAMITEATADIAMNPHAT